LVCPGDGNPGRELELEELLDVEPLLLVAGKKAARLLVASR
jgi:hypothetical protein